MSSDTSAYLKVLPLGGCGEVGLNATLLVQGQDALLIDCGALLGPHSAQGVEKLVPGLEPLFREGRVLRGVLLTHGHEDHIGGLSALLAEQDVPVFGTPYTLDLVRSRLERAPSEARQKGRLVEVAQGGSVELGPFSAEFIRVAHSLPQASALCIESSAGRVLHSGDFKIDPTPLQEATDLERLAAVGAKGVDLLLSDSTNAEVPGHGRSEQEVCQTLDRMIQETEGRVVVTLFASHLYRVRAIAAAAIRAGRRILLVGRALHRSWTMGGARGLLDFDATVLIRKEHANQIPRSRLLVLATGAQGEPMGGLARIAAGQDAALRCLPGDRVVISARTIPGNEISVRKMLNRFARQGIEVVQDRMAPVHCSGHAQRAEQKQLLELVKPKSFIPIHGERTMLEAHAQTARATGVSEVLVLEDGNSAVLGGEKLQRGPDEEISRRPMDEEGRLMDWGDIKARRKIGRAGLVVCTRVFDESGRLQRAPAISVRGIPSNAQQLRRLEEQILVGEIHSTEKLISVLKAALKGKRGLSPEIVIQDVKTRGD